MPLTNEELISTSERAYYDRRRPPNKPRRGFAEALLVASALSLTALALEGLAGLWDRAQPLKGGYAPVRGRRAREPVNTSGYRDVEHAKEKKPGVRRAVFVGDSFTYGAGVLLDDTYAKRLERLLSQARSEMWESVVLAVPGIDTAQEAAIVENEALSFLPDLLVLGYVLNDAEDSDAAERRRAAQWSEAEANRRNPAFWRRSALLRLVADRLHATAENRRRIQNHLALYREGAAGFEAVAKSLDRIASRCREQGVPFVVVLFPLLANDLGDSYPFSAAHDKVAAACRRSGAILVDLLPSFRGLDWRLLVVEGARDEHPNEIAHRIAAQALLAKLDAFLPPRIPEPDRAR